MANSITKFHVLPFFASEILPRLTSSVADSTVRMLLNRVLFCEYESTAPPSTSVASESLNGKMRVKCHVAMWSSKVQSHFSSFSHFSLWEFFFCCFLFIHKFCCSRAAEAYSCFNPRLIYQQRINSFSFWQICIKVLRSTLQCPGFVAYNCR